MAPGAPRLRRTHPAGPRVDLRIEITHIFRYGDLCRFFRLVALIVITHVIAKIVSKIVATAKIIAQTEYCGIIAEIIVEARVTVETWTVSKAIIQT